MGMTYTLVPIDKLANVGAAFLEACKMRPGLNVIVVQTMLMGSNEKGLTDYIDTLR